MLTCETSDFYYSGLERCERAAGGSKLAVRQRGSVDGKLMGAISGLPGIGSGRANRDVTAAKHVVDRSMVRLQTVEILSFAQPLYSTTHEASPIFRGSKKSKLSQQKTSDSMSMPQLKTSKCDFKYNILHLSQHMGRLSRSDAQRDNGPVCRQRELAAEIMALDSPGGTDSRAQKLRRKLEAGRRCLAYDLDCDTSQATHSAKVTFMSVRWAKEGRKAL
ncbi:hypothetical protein B0H19DRAFT_1079199 [Mycena capillaripes]|nr:hypothetical protein B0H19DRAFT_1079199 [Mycena capillaripes]